MWEGNKREKPAPSLRLSTLLLISKLHTEWRHCILDKSQESKNPSLYYKLIRLVKTSNHKTDWLIRFRSLPPVKRFPWLNYYVVGWSKSTSFVRNPAEISSRQALTQLFIRLEKKLNLLALEKSPTIKVQTHPMRVFSPRYSRDRIKAL